MHMRPIIIDTDPGQDDAIAILFALGASDALQVLGLTVVAGNVPLQLTQRNARIICEWAGRSDVPVFAGCSRPLLRPPVAAAEIHGQEGLEGPALREPQMPLAAVHAVDFLIETVLSHPEPVTLCPIGPLTNVAAALIKSPEIAPRLREIVLMGGARFEGGNITPQAEFNIYADPHAAEVVFGSGVPITVLPLDVTHKVLSTRARVERLRALGNRAGDIAAQILTTYGRVERSRFGDDGGPLHDPCVIAYLLAPQLFSGREVNVAIETTSPLSMGATVVDWWGVTGREPNARYLTEVDSDGFFDLLTRTLARLP
jgi:purine nucleosidase